MAALDYVIVDVGIIGDTKLLLHRKNIEEDTSVDTCLFDVGFSVEAFTGFTIWEGKKSPFLKKL